jgi:acyl-CoA synthetase (AMP-forming)/AMP-acid ligase II
MLYELIHAGPQSRERIAVVSYEGHVSWSQLRKRADEFVAQLAPLSGQRVGFATRATASGFAALAALDKLGVDVFLLPGRSEEDAIRRIASQLELSDAVSWNDRGPLPEIVPLRRRRSTGGYGSVTILTSGTSGRPKAARHTWASLARPVRQLRADERRHWLLTFRPQLYAGLQVTLQCFVNYDTLVTVPDGATPTDIAELMRDEQVTHCSGTPSFWRRLLLFTDHEILQQAPLRQITLGGEVTDQPLLDGLFRLFPTARIAHIYATTELGRCFSVSDGRAGFPAQWIQACPFDGIELRIVDGELNIRSKNRMIGYDPLCPPAGPDNVDAGSDAWSRTGDQVELKVDRVHFIGRASDLINVGGNKVAPLEVEAVIREIPVVADVRVYPQASSIAGQLVACDVVLNPGAVEQSTRQQITQACRSALASYQVPRVIRFVEQIELTDAGKTSHQSAGG